MRDSVCIGLRCILRRSCAAFCAAGLQSPIEVPIRHLQVVLLGDRERLRGAIAEVLAKVYRLATGAYGRLTVEVERPFWEWEEKHPKASEKQRQRKWQLIEAEYQRRDHEEIAVILKRWEEWDLVLNEAGK